MMDTRFESIDRCTSFKELLHDVELLLKEEQLFYGHGTENPKDESMAIIMHLSKSSDVLNEAELKIALDDQIREKVKEVLYQRINSTSLNRVLESGTGSGCIALSIAEAVSNVEVVATDISTDAIDVALRNAKAHGLENRVEIIESDLFENVSGVFDLIITNPPYVPDEIMLDLPKEYLHEPHMALAAGDKGLDFISRILHDAPPFLSHNGIVIIEAGIASENMEQRFDMPFIWIDFEIGGEGVAMIEASNLRIE